MHLYFQKVGFTAARVGQDRVLMLARVDNTYAGIRCFVKASHGSVARLYQRIAGLCHRFATISRPPGAA